ncbi:MAG: M15 family metallopeptidase [Gammaproteobacteria bacterium]|nr:M15 family metallopeptidase [Gammaproteobacteria bacterium]
MSKIKLSLLILILCISFNTYAETNIELIRLQEGYPQSIKAVTPTAITWKDGTQFKVQEASAFSKLASFFVHTHHANDSVSIRDLQCDSYENVFKKMYGGTASEVKKKLVTIYWMPKAFGSRYPLKVTTVNGIDKKIQRISNELEKLPMTYWKYVENPGGTFYWRNVEKEPYLSAHSFGIAMDINSHYGNYWLWDLKKYRRAFATLAHVNHIPMKIVEIFEQEGFLWGGRWRYYDTMHFEYRPELFTKDTGSKIKYNGQLGLRCET